MNLLTQKTTINPTYHVRLMVAFHKPNKLILLFFTLFHTDLKIKKAETSIIIPVSASNVHLFDIKNYPLQVFRLSQHLKYQKSNYFETHTVLDHQSNK